MNKIKVLLPRKIALPISKSKKSILLIGPRQTGKSTLIKQLKPDLSINLANQREYLNHSTDASYLESLLNQYNPKTVLIDEIQRLPSLLNTIQDILDNWTVKPKFYLTGSSARKLKRGQANLLPGRVYAYELSGLAACELDYQLNVKKALQSGFLPENYLCTQAKEFQKNLETYSATYLTEEIQIEAATRNIEGFARFLNQCANWAGHILDYSKIAQQAKVSRSTSLRFYELLEDTLIAHRVFSYQVENVDTVKHPKLYFFDTGVLNGLLFNFQASGDRVGLLFEHAVHNQIRNSALAHDLRVRIYFFRSRHGLEVDFVIDFGNKKIAVEVKAGQVSQSDVKSLLALQKHDPSINKLYAVGLNETIPRKIKSVTVCGLNEFLKFIFPL